MSTMIEALRKPGIRIVLAWVVLYGGGFIATAYGNDAEKINTGWLVITAVGLAYMAYEMPLKARRDQLFLGLWTAALVVGMLLTIDAFKVGAYGDVSRYVGAFWLALTGVATFLSAFFMQHRSNYYVSAAMQLAGAIAIVSIAAFEDSQLLISGIIAAVSMLWIVLFSPGVLPSSAAKPQR